MLRAVSLFVSLLGIAVLTGVGAARPLEDDPLPPQPRPAPSEQTLSPDGSTTTVITQPSEFPDSYPFEDPPGANLLPTRDVLVLDSLGEVMPNTLPSTPDNPYNLHPDPVVTEIDKTSPTDDLKSVITAIRTSLSRYGTVDQSAVQLGIDILEGNPIPERVYSGMAMLHYTGPERIKVVEPEFSSTGELIGGNVDVHQIWFDSHIESDTMFIDPSAVLDVPWTITYTVDTLNRGHEDFAPAVIYFDNPAWSVPLYEAGEIPSPLVLHVGMDQTFFPMEDGTRTVFEIAMTKGKYFNLSYHWGWRVHPPRVQVIENARKIAGGIPLPQHEINVFGEAPRSSEQAKLAAISQIGSLSPAKRMWTALREMRDGNYGRYRLGQLLRELRASFFDWSDRTSLPRGVELDEDSDVTLFYVNNTIYGQTPGRIDDSQPTFPDWQTRGQEFRVHLINGDYFPHGYVLADFGGSRGWENTFQSTQAIGGAGQWFTFGRFHPWMHAGGPNGSIICPPATPSDDPNEPDVLGEHQVNIQLNYEPSRRLRIYQFDPLHHDVAIWSIH